MNKEYKKADERISPDILKPFLEKAAEYLWGHVDAATYKDYIFPLMFFKRISDVYDEQIEGFVAEGGAEYAGIQANELTIKIPEGQHWSDVRKVTENVGQRLVEAFIAIEQANPGEVRDGRIIGGLNGIFGSKGIWTNKNILPDHRITSLIEHFSKYKLNLTTCPADEMGMAYEILLGKFADDAGNTAQEFYTNRTVVTLMAEILQPQSGESIYDPTCGSGGMLVKCLDYLREKGEPWQDVKVFGQEIKPETAAIARMNLYLNGVEDFSIVSGDTITTPAFIDGSYIRKFNLVLANPPYSIKEWKREAFEHDKWGRNMYGTPPQGRADYAFIQHIIASMDDADGRAAILLPHGILFRSEESDVRQKMVEADVVEAVIGLGPNLFFNSPMEACVLICNKNKPQSLKGKIVFINAKNEVTRKNAESFLEDVHISKIVSAYRMHADITDFCRVVPLSEIQGNNYDLSIQKYVFINDVTDPNEAISVECAYTEWKNCKSQLNNEMVSLLNLIES